MHVKKPVIDDDRDDDCRDAHGAERDQSASSASAPESGIDERGAMIERLERAIAEERKHSASLRETMEQFRFKAEVLEKGYSTQLADARKRSVAAEEALAGQRARLVELEEERDAMAKLLADSREEFERIAADRDRLLERFEPKGGPETIARERAGLRGQQAPSIDELLVGLVTPRDQPLGRDDGNQHAQVRADQDGPVEDMLSPDLVFQPGRDD